MIDWKKPLRTERGHLVELLGVLPEPNDGQPMVVRVFYEGNWIAETYNIDGTYLDDRESLWDLTNNIVKVRANG